METNDTTDGAKLAEAGNDTKVVPTSGRQAATPRPWKAGEAAWFRGRARDDSESGKRPITTTADGVHAVIGNVYGRANAELIVKAVNGHEDLVAALRDARRTLIEAYEIASDRRQSLRLIDSVLATVDTP